MARDYKHRARGRKKKKQVSPWLGVSVGLLVGLFIAFLVFIKMQNTSAPPQVVIQSPAPADVTEDVRDVRKEQETTFKAPEPKGPRFEFYDLLPEMEVVVPDTPPPPPPAPAKPASPPPALADKPDTPPAAPAQPAPEKTPAPQQSTAGDKEIFYIQVASVQNAAQADSLRAELALLGLETTIQTVTIDDSKTFHRVRVGPYSDLDKLNNARRTLNQRGHTGKVVRLK